MSSATSACSASMRPRRSAASSSRALSASRRPRRSACSRCTPWMRACVASRCCSDALSCARSDSTCCSSPRTRSSAAAQPSRRPLSRCSRSSTPACTSPPRLTRSQSRPIHSPAAVIRDSPCSSCERWRKPATSEDAVRTGSSSERTTCGPRTSAASVPAPAAAPTPAPAPAPAPDTVCSKNVTLPPSSPPSDAASCSSASTPTASR